MGHDNRPKCPICSKPLSPWRRIEHAAVLADQDVSSVWRYFSGVCAEHGQQKALLGRGNHSQPQEIRLKALFKPWSQHRAILPPGDRKRFTRAVHGKYHPSPFEVDRWNSFRKLSPTALEKWETTASQYPGIIVAEIAIFVTLQASQRA